MSTLKVGSIQPNSGTKVNITGSTLLITTASGHFSGSYSGDGSGLEGVDGLPYTGSGQISGSLLVTGSGDLALRVSGSTALTGSLFVSGTVSGSFIGDGSGLTGIDGYAVANSANNRIITSVDSTNGNAEANLTFDGSTLTVAGAISETSALRYKENIQPLSNSLNKVIQLNPVEYDWKNDGRHDIGLIAEEVNKVYPDLVSKQGKKVQGISYSRLTATLIGAIQELNNQNQILQNRIKTIEENKKN